MAATAIIAQAATLVINFSVGGCFALLVMIISLMMPYIAMGADAGNATSIQIIARVAAFLLLLPCCGMWFL